MEVKKKNNLKKVSYNFRNETINKIDKIQEIYKVKEGVDITKTAIIEKAIFELAKSKNV